MGAVVGAVVAAGALVATGGLVAAGALVAIGGGTGVGAGAHAAAEIRIATSPRPIKNLDVLMSSPQSSRGLDESSSSKSLWVDIG